MHFIISKVGTSWVLVYVVVFVSKLPREKSDFENQN